MAMSMMPMLTSERKREAVRRQLEGVEIQKTPETSISKPEIPTKLRGYIPGLFCNVCLQPGHAEHRCRLRESCKLGQKLGPGYVIICGCCGEENAHPADADVPRRAARIFCANCYQTGDHMTSDCKFPDGGPVTSSGSESESE